MNRFMKASAGWAVAIALVGCGGGTEETSSSVSLSQEDLNTLDEIRGSIKLDSNLTTEEKVALAHDWRRMKTIAPTAASSTAYISTFNSAIDGAYSSFFGSKSATVLDYVKTRTKYFASVESDVGGFGRPDKNTVAVNYSIFFWLDGMMSASNPSFPPSINTPEGPLANNSSRVGIVQFGDAFSDSSDSLFRIGTVVHEARHSDCPNGISSAQLNQIKNDPSHLFDYIGNCAFGHAKCPTGHPLAGISACDTGDGWGAYSSEVALFARLYDQCATGKIVCSEVEIQAALNGLNDNLNRIIKKDQMRNNTLGLPVMSHQGYTN